MSQVIRKFGNGGSPENTQNKFFEYEGVGKYEIAPMVLTLTKNLNAWADNEGLKGERRDLFIKNAVEAIKAILSGNMKRLIDGSYLSNNPSLSSTGHYDKGFLNIRTKATENNANNDVGKYLNAYLDLAAIYKEPEKEKTEKKKWNGDEYIQSEISRRWYGGNEIDSNNWFDNRTDLDRRNLLSQIMNEADYLNLYDTYDWSNTNIKSVDELKNLFLQFGTNIANNTLDNNDYNSYAAIGATNLNQYLLKPKENTPTDDYEKTQQKIIEEKKKKLIELGYTEEEALQLINNEMAAAKRQRQVALDESNKKEQEALELESFENYVLKWQKDHPFTESFASGILPASKPLNNEITAKIIKDIYNSNPEEYAKAVLSRDYFQAGNGQHLADLLDFIGNIWKMFDKYPQIGDGFIALPQTMDFNNYTTVAYNPSTRQYKEVSMLASDSLKQLVKEYLDKNKISINKQGGILFMKDGGSYGIEMAYQDWLQNTATQLAAAQEEKRASVRQNQNIIPIGISGGIGPERTDKLKEAGSRTLGEGLEGRDWWRIANATTDLASAVAAFAPGAGTLVSAGLGLGSTLSNTAADFTDDSVSTGEAFTNLGLGLGMDVAGLIPGVGTGAKVGKIARTLKPIARGLKYSLQAIGTTQAIKGASAIERIIANPEKATADDLKDALAGLQAIAGFGRYKAGKGNMSNYLKTKDVYSVRVNSGKDLEFNEKQFNQLKQANGLEEQNAVLNSIYKGETLPKAFKDRSLNPFKPKEFSLFKQSPLTKKRKVTEWNLAENPTSSNEKLYKTWLYTNENSIKRRTTQNTEQSATSNSTQTPKNQQEVKMTDDLISRLEGLKNKELNKLDIKLINRLRKAQGKKPLTSKEIESLRKRQSRVNPKSEKTLNERLQDFKSQKQRLNSGWTVDKAKQELVEANNAQRAVNSAAGAIDDLATTLNLINVSPRNKDILALPAPKLLPKSNDKLVKGLLEDLTFKNIAEKKARQQIDDALEADIKSGAKPKAKKLGEILNIPTNYNSSKGQAKGLIPDRTLKADLEIARYILHLENNKKMAKGREDLHRQQAMYDEVYAMLRQQFPSKFKGKSDFEIQKAIEKSLDAKNRNNLQYVKNKKSSKKKEDTKKKESSKKKKEPVLLSLFKSGGLIPKFESPAGPIRMLAKSKNYFNRNLGLSDYNWGEDIANFLKTGTIDDYIIGFNGREDNYDALTKASGGTYTNRQYISNPLATTVLSGLNTYNSGWDKYIRSNIQGYGVTEGQKTGTDPYFGDRTWERSLGRITPELAANFNSKYLNKYGIELFDKGDGGFRLRKLQTPSVNLPEVEVTAPKNSTTSSRTGNFKAPFVDKDKNSPKKFTVRPEDLMDFGRMLGGFITNVRAAEEYKKGLKPLHISTTERYAPAKGKFEGIAAANLYEADMMHLANRNATSDAQNNFATLLEVKSKMAPTKLQAVLADKAEYNRTSEIAQQYADEAKFARMYAANKNRASDLAIDAAKHQIDSATISANYADVLAPYFAGISNRLRQGRTAYNQANYNTESKKLGIKYNDLYSKATTDAERNKLLSDYQAELGEYIKSLYEPYWMFKRLSSTPLSGFVFKAASGGRLTAKERLLILQAKDFNKRLLEDNKLFHKDIMESKREHNKLIMNMSNLTAELIKNGMTWK